MIIYKGNNMNAEQFTYWLQGFFEMTDAKNLSPNQVLMIKEHLKLVFEKKTPQIDPGLMPMTPTLWHTQPLCSPGILGGSGNGVEPEDWKVKITCDQPNAIRSGALTSNNVLNNCVVDEHTHAGQAKRITVTDLSGSKSTMTFVQSKTCVSC